MRVTKLAGLALVTIAVTACTSVGPSSTPFISTPVTPVPGASALPSIALPSLPAVSIPPESISPETQAPSDQPTLPPPTEKPTPKPTKKPTPTPSPTPPPTKVALSIDVNTSDIPNPWYNNTDYTIPINVSSFGADVPSIQVKVSIPEEAFSTTYTTGTIADGATDTHNVTINVPAIGPATFTLSIKTPAGFVDVDLSNNKRQIPIEVQLAP